MTMLERIARDVNDGMPTLSKWETLSPEMKAECVDVVRRVVKAMREPTRDVLTAFVDDAVSIPDAAVRWAAAVDSILSTQPQEGR